MILRATGSQLWCKFNCYAILYVVLQWDSFQGQYEVCPFCAATTSDRHMWEKLDLLFIYPFQTAK